MNLTHNLSLVDLVIDNLPVKGALSDDVHVHVIKPVCLVKKSKRSS